MIALHAELLDEAEATVEEGVQQREASRGPRMSELVEQTVRNELRDLPDALKLLIASGIEGTGVVLLSNALDVQIVEANNAANNQ
jgi:hypothetical protein